MLAVAACTAGRLYGECRQHELPKPTGSDVSEYVTCLHAVSGSAQRAVTDAAAAVRGVESVQNTTLSDGLLCTLCLPITERFGPHGTSVATVRHSSLGFRVAWHTRAGGSESATRRARQTVWGSVRTAGAVNSYPSRVCCNGIESETVC
jgi:hypothetical protein